MGNKVSHEEAFEQLTSVINQDRNKFHYLKWSSQTIEYFTKALQYADYHGKRDTFIKRLIAYCRLDKLQIILAMAKYEQKV